MRCLGLLFAHAFRLSDQLRGMPAMPKQPCYEKSLVGVSSRAKPRVACMILSWVFVARILTVLGTFVHNLKQTLKQQAVLCHADDGIAEVRISAPLAC